MTRAVIIAMLAGLAAVGALAYKLNRGAEAQAELARMAEAGRLSAQGLVVEERRQKDALQADRDRLAAENPELRAALERAEKAARGARVVSVVSASTGSATATGEPRPPSPVATSSIVTPKQEAPCLLAPGDRAEIRVDQVTFETRAGNRVLVGAAAAWRLDPAPKAQLVSGTWQADVTEALGSAPPVALGARWGAGVAILGSAHGLAPAIALAAPPLRALGLSMELSVAAGWGTEGPAGSALLLVRP